MKQEKVGKVNLDLTHYPGEDFYCDGLVEDEILEIVKTYSEVEYPKIIEERKSWPVMYHLSAQRENIVSWLPLKGKKVLEIGSGCGAITGAIARQAALTDCVDLSKKRSLINAYRHENMDNINIHVGNFTDIEPELDTDYDCALLIGVFEYGQSYIGGDTPFEDFLKIIRKHVKSDGIIAIAIENRYGLKYWAGCREDHLGTFFSSIECYKDGGGVRTFSDRGLKKIFRAVGENDYTFYYPYPDYKFMTTLYSDRKLPGKGELNNNMRNYDRDRLKLFDEAAAFDGIVDEGQFPFFSNSYMVILGPKPECDYIRYSNDRMPCYQLSTRIAGNQVIKQALNSEGLEHIRKMNDSFVKLSHRYSGSKLNICPCSLSEDGSISFPLLKGTPLCELMDECLLHDDVEGFSALFMDYLSRISYGEGEKISNLDFVFSNILVDGDQWYVIDYEWVNEKAVPARELAFRALYCYLLENENRNKFNFDLIINKLGLSQNEIEGLQEEEAAFQKSVTGKRLAMGELRELIGGAIITPDSFVSTSDRDRMKKSVQIYTDYGKGFSEDDSFFIDEVYDWNGEIEFSVQIDSKACKLRIDPYMDYCMTEIKEISLNDEVLNLTDNKRVYVNGRKLASGNTGGGVTAVFYYNDPNIVIEVKDKVRSTGNKLHVRMKTTETGAEITEALKKELSKRIRL